MFLSFAPQHSTYKLKTNKINLQKSYFQFEQDQRAAFIRCEDELLMLTLSREETRLICAVHVGFLLISLASGDRQTLLFPKGIKNIMIKSQKASSCELSGQLAVCGLRRDIYMWSLDTGSHS